MRRHGLALYILLAAAATACSDSPTAPGFGYIKGLVQTTGGDPDDAFEIVADSVSRVVAANSVTVLQLSEGSHTLELKDVAPNCVVDGSDKLSLDVARDDTAAFIFKVSCLQTGLRVLVSIAGPDSPTSFEIGVSSSTQVAIPNQSLVISRLPAGRYHVTIRNSASNCAITGDSAVDADVVNRQMTNVLFNVVCTPLPRNGEIAFYDNGVLAVVKADGSGQGRLTYGTAPSWSRDGTRILYSNTTCDYYGYVCSGSLALIDPLTQDITSLTRARNGLTPDWSPTDDVIVYIEGESGNVYLYTVATGDTVKVPLPQDTRVYHASWSHDGSRLIASCQFPGAGSQICTFNRDGSDIRTITQGPDYKGDAAWSPDGKRIAYTSYANGPSTIITMNPDGSNQRTVTFGSTPAWSPDSRQLVFSGNNGLFVVNEDGTGLRRLTTGIHYYPAWKP